jgi:hypothetical protein
VENDIFTTNIKIITGVGVSKELLFKLLTERTSCLLGPMVVFPVRLPMGQLDWICEELLPTFHWLFFFFFFFFKMVPNSSLQSERMVVMAMIKNQLEWTPATILLGTLRAWRLAATSTLLLFFLHSSHPLLERKTYRQLMEPRVKSQLVSEGSQKV